MEFSQAPVDPIARWEQVPRWRAARLKLSAAASFIRIGKLSAEARQERLELTEVVAAHPWLQGVAAEFSSTPGTSIGSAVSPLMTEEASKFVKSLVEHARSLKRVAEPADPPLPPAVLHAAVSEFARLKQTQPLSEQEALQHFVDCMPAALSTIPPSQQQMLIGVADSLLSSFESRGMLVLAHDDAEKLHFVKATIQESLASTRHSEACRAQAEAACSQHIRVAIEKQFERSRGHQANGGEVHELDQLHKQILEMVQRSLPKDTAWQADDRARRAVFAPEVSNVTIAIDFGFESARDIHTPQASERITVRKSANSPSGRPSCAPIVERASSFLLPGCEPGRRCVPSLAPLERQPLPTPNAGLLTSLRRGFTFREKVEPLPTFALLPGLDAAMTSNSTPPPALACGPVVFPSVSVGEPRDRGTRRGSRVHPAFDDDAALHDSVTPDQVPAKPAGLLSRWAGKTNRVLARRTELAGLHVR